MSTYLWYPFTNDKSSIDSDINESNTRENHIYTKTKYDTAVITRIATSRVAAEVKKRNGLKLQQKQGCREEGVGKFRLISLLQDPNIPFGTVCVVEQNE